MADHLKQSLVAGLTSSPKYIPSWYNYDNVGSKLQHEGCELNQDYYLTRSTISVLEHSVQDIILNVPYDLTLVDLGSGNCSKTKILIDELLKRQTALTFYPIDISGDFLLEAVKELSEEYDDSLVVHPIAADYVQGIDQLKRIEGAKLILWIGSIINLSYDDQVNTLRMISTIMTDKCRLVFSADITQDRKAILKAYNDEAGVIRTFYEYGIARLNKEEGSDIDLARFTYEVDFISDSDPQYMSNVRAYIQAKEAIRYPIPGLKTDLVMEKGERLYLNEGSGISCKYTLEQLQNIVKKSGLRLEDTWTDEQQHAVFCRCETV
ncbi:Histidine-specific methyltransferase EgtD [Mizuhopecten yessoensis]|uniref:Histidine-specific methyltransferase EgtD n=1 Tax=Mizuhopecten yessoensis TaxID=6573 RepID=A0A210QHE0_MIZYE|nr:Histidine-specific methyltransferase EgtD [Mizuhopecten yessoensis]